MTCPDLLGGIKDREDTGLAQRLRCRQRRHRIGSELLLLPGGWGAAAEM